MLNTWKKRNEDVNAHVRLNAINCNRKIAKRGRRGKKWEDGWNKIYEFNSNKWIWTFAKQLQHKLFCNIIICLPSKAKATKNKTRFWQNEKEHTPKRKKKEKKPALTIHLAKSSTLAFFPILKIGRMKNIYYYYYFYFSFHLFVESKVSHLTVYLLSHFSFDLI